MIAHFKLLANLVHRSRNNQILSFCCGKSTSSCTIFNSFKNPMKLNKWNKSEQSPWTYSKCVNYYGTLKHSIVSDITHGIDPEALKEKCRRHLLLTGNELCPSDLLQDVLKMRFDEAVSSFNEQEKRMMKIIKLEHSFLFSEGYAIPSPEEMTNEIWLQAMTIETLEERFNYYVIIEAMKVQHASSADIIKTEDVPNERVTENPSSMFYESPDAEVRWGNLRLAHAMQFGIPLVVDMDFVDMNSAAELAPLTQQLWDMYCVNRSHPAPFHIMFTNCTESNPIYRHLILHHMIKSSFVLATFTERSHTDLFPKQDLVYLSAQSNDCLGEFNPNTVYIVGAYYDPMVRKKGSLARARQHKIRCSRFPISENVRWRHQASKDLDMNHVVAILHSIKSHKSWKEALNSHVPMLINNTS